MERLTKYEPCEGGIPLVTVEDEQSALQRLAAYEDAEEAGLLVRLPLNEWIPVTERLPEKSGDYLVFDACGNLYVNEWHFLLRMWQFDDSRITHWMPLPEPPKEEA